MKKKIALLQLKTVMGEPEKNYAHAAACMEEAMKEHPDILVLPETCNVGFFPHNLRELADPEGRRTQEVFGEFAAAHHVNIVAGSAAVMRDGKVYNTSYVFDRRGVCVACYDKIHSFSPAGEDRFFEGGNHTVQFRLDGILCSLVICYDLRFPEIIRASALQGVDLFFVPAQWPLARKAHWVTLNTARAIENQMYLCAVNGCGWSGKTRYGGNSLLLSPWGEEICHLGTEEEIRCGDIDLDVIQKIRKSINVFRDRKPDIDRI